MKKKQLFISIFGICFILLVIIGLSYSYYVAKTYGNDAMSSTGFTTDYLKLSYNGSSNVSGYILSPNDTLSTTFTVYNNSDFDLASYDVNFSNVINKYNYYSYLVWTLTCTSYDGSSSVSGTCSGVSTETMAPLKSQKMITASAINKNYTHKYVLTVKYKESGFNQAIDKGKEFSTDITINKKTGFLSYDAIGNEGGSSVIIAKGTPNFENIASTNEGMYATNDSDGKAYYYRGLANNYVSFANQTWRIVRVNGDGTIRIVLDDYAKDTNSSYISTSYNSSASCGSGSIDNISKAVECAKYGSGDYASTSIKNVIDSWYTNNITGTNDSYVVSEKYCNDISYSSSGDDMVFGSVARLLNGGTKTPSLLCTKYSDLFIGNPYVVNAKAGLMTADDLVFGGGKWSTTNTNVYYYKDANDGLTMSPFALLNPEHNVEMFYYDSMMMKLTMFSSMYFKPVINLDSNIIISGIGTVTNPYKIEKKYTFPVESGSSEEPDDTSTLKYKILANEGGIANIYARSSNVNYQTVNSDEGMYASYDNDGVTIFYRGTGVVDNYVTFAGLTWRIIRINGDGSIRIMLNSVAKNPSNNNYAVSYNSACTYGNIDTVSDASECIKYGYGTYAATSVKSTVDTWYANNITGNNLNYIATNKFCNEYSLYPMAGSSSYQTVFYMKHRLGITVPDHTCSNELSLNVGLISVIDAMNYFGVNTNQYSYGVTCLTMSPSYYYFSGTSSNDLYMYNLGTLTAYVQSSGISASGNNSIVPVVSLKGNVVVTGSGSSATPYVVSGLA